MTEQAPETIRDPRQRTRDDLLEAATQVFAERGYHGTSVEEVAEAAGYTKGAVYSNFSSKEELFLALLDRHSDEASATFEALVETTPPADRPEAVGRGYADVEVFSRSWFLLELEFLLYAARNPRVQPRIKRRARETSAWITGMVERHLEEIGAEADDETAADLAGALEALAHGLMLTGLRDPDRTDPSRLFTQAVEWLTRAAADGRADG